MYLLELGSLAIYVSVSVLFFFPLDTMVFDSLIFTRYFVVDLILP